MLAKRIHRLTAILLGTFILSHLLVHLTAIFGPETHKTALGMVQIFYRNLIGESLLVMAILVQMVSGISRLRFRNIDGWARLQVISGIYLLVFFAIHTSAALYTHHIVGLETDFFWAAGSLYFSPIKYGFALYYTAAVLAVFTHLAAALKFGWPDISGRLLALIPAGGLAIGILIVAIFGGAFYAIEIGPDVQAYYQGNFGALGLTPPESEQ